MYLLKKMSTQEVVNTDRIVSAMSLTKRMSYLFPTVASQNQNRFVELQS